jgi:hypothetical protein
MSQNVGTSSADVFRRKLEEARARREAEGFPMEFAGFPCKVRQLSRLHFIRAGRMPEYLTRLIVERINRGAEGAREMVEQASPEQMIQGEEFMRHAVCSVLIEPRVAPLGSRPEGGYLYGDLVENAPEFVEAVYAWIMADCPLPEEEREEGVLSVADAEKFPDGEGRGTGATPGGESEVVGEAAARADAADGERPAGE